MPTRSTRKRRSSPAGAVRVTGDTKPSATSSSDRKSNSDAMAPASDWPWSSPCASAKANVSARSRARTLRICDMVSPSPTNRPSGAPLGAPPWRFVCGGGRCLTMPHVQRGLLWRLRRARKLPDARAAGLRDTDRMPDGALRYHERFEGAAAAELALARAELEACNFVACDLTEASLQGARLTACRFERCELALADLADASLRDVTFERCRLTGVDFGRLERDPLGLEARFEGCDLSFALFRGLDLRAFAFEGCLLPEAEFTRCDLRGVSFAGSDLARCGFADCDLRDADLRAARG